MTNKSGDFPPHDMTSLLPIGLLRAWDDIYRTIEFFGKTKNCETVVDGLQSTQITRNNVRLNRIPCRPGASESSASDQVLSSCLQQCLHKSEPNPSPKKTRPYVSCNNANTIKFPANVPRKAESKIRF